MGTLTSSHSQTNLSALPSSQLPLQVFRNGSGSSAGTSGSRDQSPTYQNWSQHHHHLTANNNNHNVEALNSSKKSASDCTSSTECNSEDSDRHSDNCAENSGKTPHLHSVIPTPAPRTTLTEKLNSLQNGSIRSVSYGMVWYGMVWYCMVWYGMVWYGMVWYGMVWYGMVLYGMYGMVCMVWYGMVCMVWYVARLDLWYGMVPM